MMRCALGAAVACAAVLALGPATASADVVSKQVFRCELDMQWQIAGSGGSSVANVTYDTSTGTPCKNLRAGVEDDLDPFLIPEDRDEANAQTYRLVGVSSEGLDYTFAGLLAQEGGPAQGWAVIGNGLFNGQTSAVWPDGTIGTAVHTGTGSCGSRCFKTHSVWAAVRS